MQRPRIAVAVAGAIGLAFTGALAQAADWPQWRGPNRDGKSTETGLLKQWPKEGPTLLWTARDLGGGFSGVTIKDDIIYTTGISGGNLQVFAFNADGTPRWKQVHGPGWTGSHAGARAVPTIDGDSVYLLSGRGLLRQYDRKTGRPGWSVDVVKTFGGGVPRWGYAESVLVDGTKLICTPGGSSVMVALNKDTGQVVWRSSGVTMAAHYASPIVFEMDGLRQYANLCANALVAFHAETGKFLWRYDRPAGRTANCPTPIFADGQVFSASGYNIGGGLVQVTVQGQNATARQVWDTTALINHHGGYVLVDGAIYGHSNRGNWTCLDLKTGAVRWQSTGVGKGSVTYADGMLYTYGERSGDLALVRATPEKYDEVSRFRVPSGGSGPYWAHPVVCGGRLYVRHDNNLYCFDIEAPQAAPKPGDHRPAASGQ